MQNVAAHQAVTPSGSVSNGVELDFSQLFQAHYGRVYNYLRYRVNTPADAEDIIGAVFEQAYQRRKQFDPARGAFTTWLFSIAHHTLVDHYRSRERRSAWESEAELPADLVAAEPSPEARLVQQEMMTQMLQGLERLNERDREIISLKFAGKLRNTEIAEIMQMKEKTVSVVLLRAVQRLRQYMTEEVG